KGDLLIGLPSSGLHTNGYSLARNVLLRKFSLHDSFDELGTTLGAALLAVHRSYYKAVHPLLHSSLAGGVHGLSHITGGGIEGNTMRVVPKGLRLAIDWEAWERPALFTLIQKTGNVPEREMRRTFNLGVGMILVVSPSAADKVIAALKRKNEKPFVMGAVARR
ncbi:MAG: AIR synthase-related protein, partial [Bacteroidota bacterium]